MDFYSLYTPLLLEVSEQAVSSFPDKLHSIFDCLPYGHDGPKDTTIVVLRHGACGHVAYVCADRK
jgi:hypothetical protein